MPEWIPLAATGAILLIVLLVLIKLHAIKSEQAEITRTLNLMMDTVESLSRSTGRQADHQDPEQPADRPSIISYQKPKLVAEPQNKPPPPPPAKLKRW